MRNRETIAIVYPAQPTSNYDVAVGYEHALDELGHTVIRIPYHNIFVDWNEYYRFFAITRGITGGADRNKEEVVRSASLNVLLKTLDAHPDIVIVIDGTSLDKVFFAWMRKIFSAVGISTVLISTECPYQDKTVGLIAPYFDRVYVNDLASAMRMGHEYLPCGYDKAVHFPANVSDTYKHDVVFIGSGFPERVEMLSAVDWEGIDFAFYGHYSIDHDHPLAPYYKDSHIQNAEATKLYNGAKICINLNRTSVDYKGSEQMPVSESLSPRVYEIAATKSFCISEYRQELERTFGSAIPFFNTGEELSAMIHKYLADDKKRETLARRAHKLAAKHSYTDRAKEILDRHLYSSGL